MSTVKTYFTEEFKCQMLGLSHPEPTDFYLSVWQKSITAIPLLIWRSLLFLTSIGIVFFSLTTSILDSKIAFWCIYLTHWGLMNIISANAFAFATSICCFIAPISDKGRLPWYVKVYWVLYNTATPAALLITVFYWTVLYDPSEEDRNLFLDISVHALNSVVMLGLVISSSLPSRVLHVYQPMLMALLYAIFGISYYFAGGTNHKGNRWVYSVVDWSRPGPTAGVVAATVVLLGLLHFVVVAIAVGRNAVASRLVPKTDGRRDDGD